MTFSRVAAMIAAAALLLPAAAIAHPKLLSVTPAANATVTKTNKVSLAFSEQLMPKLSTATLTMTGMPGMPNHGEMKIAVVTKVGPDGKSLIVTSSRPLSAGSYRVDWAIVGGDTHRLTGAHNFSVK